MKLSDYFDPYKQEHLEMFNKFTIYGVMPHEFKLLMADQSIAEDYMWYIIAVQKMAKAWVGEKLHHM